MPDIAGNTLGTATPLNLTSTVQTLSDTATLTGNDFYRFVLNYRSSLNVSLTGLSANANITLLDRDGNPVILGGVPQSSNNPSTFAESINTPLEAGIYYLRVAPENNVPSANYTLGVSIANTLSTDLVWRNYTDGSNVTWQLSGTNFAGISSLPPVADLNWQIQAVGDLNRDGFSDLIWRNQATGDNVVWFLDSSTALTGIEFLPAVADTNWRIQGAGDFNQDGKTDLVWRNYASGDNVVWTLDGTTLTGVTFLPAIADTNWWIQGTGDFNQDGKTDLVWRNYASGDNVVWTLNGTTLTGVTFLPAIADTHWQIQGTGDFNRDGKTDLVWRNQFSGDNVIWTLNGTTLTGIESLPPVTDLSWRVQSTLVRAGTPPTIDTAGNALSTAFNLGSNLRGNATYQGAINIPDADDYYQFAIANRTNLTLGLTGLTADLNLQLLSSDGTVLQASSLAGTAPESIARSLEAGTYYARVFTNGGSNSPYKLGVSLGSVPVLVTNAGLTLTEGGVSNLSNTLLRVTDPDVTTAQVVYTLGGLPTVGSLSLNGAALSAGAKFTQADLDDGTRLVYRHNGSETTADSFSFTVTDGVGGTIASTPFTIGVTPVNDRPVLTVPTATQSADQATSAPITGISITDVDAGAAEVTVTLTANNGLLSLNTIAGLRFTQGTGSQNAAVIFSGSLSAVNAALTTLIYRSNDTFGGTDTISLGVNDNGNTGLGGPLSDSKTISVRVTPINKPPIITLPATLSVREDTSQTIAGISIADPDAGGGNITASLSVLNGLVSLGSVAGVSVTAGTGTRDRNVVFSGPIGAVNAALNNLTYQGNSNFNGTDSILVSVSDNGNTGNGVPLSDQRSLSILVTPVNDAPVLTIPTGPQSANENSTLSLTGISVQDVDAGSGNLTVSLSAVNGALSVATIPGITFSGTGSQGSSIIFSGTLLAINSALATLNYRGNLNYSGADTLTIDVSDNGNTGSGIALNDRRTIAIDVLAFNSPPVIALPTAPAVNTATNSAIPGISISDPDAGNGKALVTIAAASGILTVQPNPSITFLQGTTNTGGRLTFEGTLTAINQTLATLIYRSNPAFVGFERLTISVNDEGNTGIGTALSDTKTLFVSVGGAVNQVPIALNDSASVNEGGNLTGTSVLVNDRDLDNNTPLSAQLVTGPTSAASFTLNPDGTFSYIPKPLFNGTDSFTYSARDQLGGISTPATVTIAVASVNDAPIANNDSFSVNEDGTLPGDVSINDSDPDNNLPLTAQVVTGPANALSFSLNPNGTFTYTPKANFNGSDSFVYRVSDSLGALSGSATANIVVAAVNDAPIALNDSYTSDRAGNLAPAQSVLFNDTDVDSTALTVSLVSGLSTGTGTLSLNPNGTFSYTPGTFVGTTSFTYRVSDGLLSSNTATATIAVAQTNSAPLAVNETYAVSRTGVVSPAVSILANDSDPDPGTTLTAKLVNNVKSGTLSLNTVSGTFTYTPNSGFLGTDSFTYRVNDGVLDSATTATATLVVGNSVPQAVGESYTVSRAGVVSPAVSILANDTDIDPGTTLAAKLVDNVKSGTLSLNTVSGTFTYTPNSGFLGTDSFTYRVNDGTIDSTTTATATLVVANAAPVAANDTYSTPLNTLLASPKSVLTNDTDADPGTTLTAKLVDTVKSGTLTLNTVSGTFTYTPNTGFTGFDSFTYRANDGTIDSANSATVTIGVGVNTAPSATSETYVLPRNGSLTPPLANGVLANDSDAEGNTLTAISVTAPRNAASFTLNPNGIFTYKPTAGFAGTDSFVYKANDGALDSTPTTVTLNVTAGLNTAPVAKNDRYTNAITGQPFVVGTVITGVLNNDTDAESDPVSAIKVTNPQSGSVTLNPDGTFTYTPTSATFAGTDSFTYKANDGIADSNTATVTIVVSSNTPPNAIDDTGYTASRGRLLTIDQIQGVLKNDTDAESGTATTAKLVTTTGNGTLSLNPNGSFTYQSGSTFVGTDSFTYRSNDGALDSTRTATAFIVVAANTAPIAVNDPYTTSRNRPKSTTNLDGVLRNDTDAESDPLTATLLNTVLSGSLTLNPNGSFTYTPTTGFVGTDSFTYRASDGSLSSTATAFITVAANTAPIAQSETFFFNTGQGRTIPARGVLTNDTDAEGNSLTVSPVSPAVSGLLSSNPDGSFTYTPNAGFTGTDSFTYRVSDGSLTSDAIATATLVVAANAAPVTQPDSFSVNRNGILSPTASRNVLTNDTDVDTLTASLVTAPGGSLTLNGDGTFTYTPTPGFTGTDSFVYRASDGSLSSLGTAFITVKSVSGAPIAVADTYGNVNTNSPYTSTISVLANDTDPEGDRLFATVGTAPTKGTVTLNRDGSFLYTPTTANFIGTDSFTYTATDGINTTTPATVTLIVGAVNNAPVVIVPGSQVGFRGSDLIIPTGLSVSDVDAGTNPIALTLVATSGNLSLSTTANLTVTNNGSRTVTVSGTQSNINAALANFKYRPISNTFTGTDSIVITANDGGFTGGTTLSPKTGTGTVTVNVTAGPTIVRDINTLPLTSGGTASSNPSSLTAAGNTVYFAADNRTNGVELWKSDGTSAGTTLVSDINPDGDSSARNLTVVGNNLFFTANDGVRGTELWKVDLTTGAASIVLDIRTGVPSSTPTNLVNFNGTLFFRANDGSGLSLWKTDGTGAGTVRVGTGVSQPASLTPAGTTLYFTANNGAELWKSDGTNSGTRLIQSLGSTAAITNLTAIGNTVFFTAAEGTGFGLWRSDGSTATRLAPVSSVTTFNPNLINLGDTLYFFTKTGSNFTLSKSTAAGVVSTVQTLPPGGLDPTSLTTVGNTLYFVVDAGTSGSPKQQLWKSDGATASLVKDINPTGNAAPTSLTNLNGTLTFIATDSTGTKLWRSDGTATGTIAISAAFTGPTPTSLTAVGNKLYFTADTGTSGIELWAL